MSAGVRSLPPARWAACLLVACAMQWFHAPLALAKPVPPEPRLVVFPLSGEVSGPLADVPQRLTEVIVAEAEQRHTNVTLAQASLADTAMLLGCDPRSSQCHQQILKQLNSDEAIFGDVASSPNPNTPGVTVSLTRISRNADPVTQNFTITASSPDTARKEFASLVPAFFGGGSRSTDSDAPSTDGPFAFHRVKNSTWAVIGGGGLLTMTGLILWTLASGKQGDIDSAPTETAADLERLRELEDSASSQAALGNVFVLMGLATAGTGVYLMRRQARTPAPDATSSPAVSPMPVEGGMGVMFTIGWPR